MSPLVSIVIPTYNRAEDLRRALRSAILQTYRQWELIVVDNHSTDSTREVVQQCADSRIRLLSVHNNGIIAMSRNAGIAAATGEYVAFLDSDDWWKARKLELCVAKLERGADIVYHDLYRVHRAGQRLNLRRVRTRSLAIPIYDDLLDRGNALTTSSILVRRELMARIGGFSEERALLAWEDYDAWLRLAKVTDRFVRLRKTLGYYWAGGGNTSSPQRTIANMGVFRERYLIDRAVRHDAQFPAWCHYGLGRAYYHLGADADCLQHMWCALRGPLPPSSIFAGLATVAAAWARSRIRPGRAAA